MSFSSECKEELCRAPMERACCRMAELSALFMTVGALTLLGRGQVSVQFTVEGASIAKRIFLLLQKELQMSAQLHYITLARLGGKRKCVLTLGPTQAPALLYRLELMERGTDGEPSLRATTPRPALGRACCRRAFLRGAMLGCGSVTKPDLGYHLELSTPDEATRLAVAKCLQSCELPVHQTERGGSISLYLKQSDQIAAFLTLVGAHQAVMALEDLRVRRQVLGAVNRAMNCDAANLQKQVNASERQRALIEKLIASDAYGSLPPALQEIARARLHAPDASLQELGEQLDPPIGKSGVNHRMRRLMQIAEGLGPSEGGPAS